MTSPVSILHVDDNPDFGDLVAEFMGREQEQFEITTVTSASEGLECLDDGSQAFECVVSDFDMPEMNGIEFLEAIREEYPDLPFVLFTGKGSEEVASEAISAGATDYLQKGTGTDQYTVLANRVQNAVDQYRSQRHAEEQKRIAEVIRSLNRALVYADSTAEIEQDVCAILSDAEPYVTACVAGVNTETMRIEPRTWAGNAAGYFDALDMSVDDDSPGRHAPGGRAFHERTIAISQNISEDSKYKHWRETATERGFRSLAVVPLEYDETLFGLLALFADRSNAFDDTEQEMLAELGDDIAHAMHTQEMQTELRTTASRLEALFDRSPDMINIHDTAGNLIDPNPKICDETGYERCELTEMSVWDLDTKIDPERATKRWESMAVGDSHRFESEYKRKDGSNFPVEVHIRRLDLAGEDRLVAIGRDITERKKNDRKRQQIISRMNDAVIEIDADWQVTLVNERTEEFSGRSEEELLGQDFWDIFAEARGTRFEEQYRRAMDTREQISITDYYAGVDEWFDIQVYPNDDGGLAFYFRTITEYKDRQRELRQTERRYQAILEDPNILAGVLDTEGRLLEINRTALEYVDAETEAVLGELIWETPWWTTEQRPIIKEKVQEALAGNYVGYEATLAKPDGEPYSVSGLIRPVTDEGGQVISLVISARDVTERTEYERNLELRTKAINEAPVGIVMTDPSQEDNPITYANDEFLELTGYSQDEVLGRNCRFLQGPETEQREVDKMRTAIEAEEPVTVELQNYRKDGSMFWNRVSIAPVYNEAGELFNYIGFQETVTERKKRQQQLQVIERVLRHNVRNDMNVIRTHAELIESMDIEEASDHARQIKSKSDQLIGLTEKERAITEILVEQPQLTEIDLCSMLEQSVAVARQGHQDATITVDCPAGLTVTASTRFKEAIDELIQNALTHNDATAPEISITVSDDSERVQITVSDNGPPIPEMEQAVLRGQTHEEPLYHGSGLGLWLVNLLVSRSAGTISCDGTESDGNDITITLSHSCLL